MVTKMLLGVIKVDQQHNHDSRRNIPSVSIRSLHEKDNFYIDPVWHKKSL